MVLTIDLINITMAFDWLLNILLNCRNSQKITNCNFINLSCFENYFFATIWSSMSCLHILMIKLISTMKYGPLTKYGQFRFYTRLLY